LTQRDLRVKVRKQVVIEEDVSKKICLLMICRVEVEEDRASVVKMVVQVAALAEDRGKVEVRDRGMVHRIPEMNRKGVK
jgi:hypothetical protein